MAIIRICAEEITAITQNYSATLTCTSPACTPIGAGHECNVVVYNTGINLSTTPPSLCFSYNTQFQYEYACHGSTFMDYCEIREQSACVDLPSGVTLCTCGVTPTLSYAPTCNPGSITTTPTSVTGLINVDFSVSNLCVPTTFCVSTVPCP